MSHYPVFGTTNHADFYREECAARANSSFEQPSLVDSDLTLLDFRRTIVTLQNDFQNGTKA